MNYSMDCTIYYSMIGERFNIYDRNDDPNIFRTKALVNISAEKDLPGKEFVTEMKIPHEVQGGAFFSSDTQCIIVNGKNQILKLGGKYRLDVNMYRSLNDPGLFSIIFKEKSPGCPQEWVSL